MAMIYTESDDKKTDYGAVSQRDVQPVAGPSQVLGYDEDGDNSPPPPFQDYQEQTQPEHVLIDFGNTNVLIPAGGEEPPPAFTTYDAEFQLDSSGNVYSHDEHLNTDGEALYRFLLTHAATPPTFQLQMCGTHDETRTRLVSRTDSKGHVKHETELYTETVTDFDFTIDISQQLLSTTQRAPVHWSAPDERPTYRGYMVRDVGIPGTDLRHATKQDTKTQHRWAEEQKNRGLPPWVANYRDVRQGQGENPYSVLQSSWTVRQWADDYCSSPKKLKEFVYEKVAYGWDIATLKSAIHSLIVSTYYRGNIKVDFVISHSKVIVRSSNRLSRALSNGWIKFLLIITLIYPFIWLFRRFHSRGGGRWEVCGGAYALKSYVDAPADLADTEPTRVAGARLVKTAAGVKTLIGEPEGEWFRRWEGTIRNAVVGHRQERIPLTVPDEMSWNAAAEMLDGYRRPARLAES